MNSENVASPAAEKLVAHFGGRQKAADALGVVGETIRLWRKNGIPLEAAIDVEARSGGVVTAEQILHEAKQRASTREDQ